MGEQVDTMPEDLALPKEEVDTMPADLAPDSPADASTTEENNMSPEEELKAQEKKAKKKAASPPKKKGRDPRILAALANKKEMAQTERLKGSDIKNASMGAGNSAS